MERFGVALAGVLSVLAWRVAWERREHRPIAWFVTANLVADLALWLLTTRVLVPAREALGGAPFFGWARVAFHANQLAVLVWPAGIAATSAATLAQRRAWPVSVCLAAVSVVLALAYPTVRGALLGRVYFGLELAALFLAVGLAVVWWCRRDEPTFTTDSCGVLVLAQVGVAIHWSPFDKGWDWQATTIIGAYMVLTFLHAGELCRSFLRRFMSF